MAVNFLTPDTDTTPYALHIMITDLLHAVTLLYTLLLCTLATRIRPGRHHYCGIVLSIVGLWHSIASLLTISKVNPEARRVFSVFAVSMRPLAALIYYIFLWQRALYFPGFPGRTYINRFVIGLFIVQVCTVPLYLVRMTIRDSRYEPRVDMLYVTCALWILSQAATDSMFLVPLFEYRKRRRRLGKMWPFNDMGSDEPEKKTSIWHRLSRWLQKSTAEPKTEVDPENKDVTKPVDVQASSITHPAGQPQTSCQVFAHDGIVVSGRSSPVAIRSKPATITPGMAHHFHSITNSLTIQPSNQSLRSMHSMHSQPLPRVRQDLSLPGSHVGARQNSPMSSFISAYHPHARAHTHSFSNHPRQLTGSHSHSAHLYHHHHSRSRPMEISTIASFTSIRLQVEELCGSDEDMRRLLRRYSVLALISQILLLAYSCLLSVDDVHRQMFFVGLCTLGTYMTLSIVESLTAWESRFKPWLESRKERKAAKAKLNEEREEIDAGHRSSAGTDDLPPVQRTRDHFLRLPTHHLWPYRSRWHKVSVPEAQTPAPAPATVLENS